MRCGRLTDMATPRVPDRTFTLQSACRRRVARLSSAVSSATVAAPAAASGAPRIALTSADATITPSAKPATWAAGCYPAVRALHCAPCGPGLAGAAGRSVAWHGRYAGGAPEEGGEPVAGAGRSRHRDRRREQWVPAGAGDQHWGYRQQVDGQGARDRLALPARPGYVPPVDGDLEGCRRSHDAGRQRAAVDVDNLALVAGAGPGVQQLAGTIAERPGRVSCQVSVLRGRVQPNASGFDALTEHGQGFAGVP